MIIKTLTLHNFMSYADVCVDLSSVSVACLSGQNGSGKSALLDAITWALWEQGRSSSDELIRLGEREMWVDLIFEYEGRTYRVRRSRLKRASKGGMRGTSKGMLDLQMLASVSQRARLKREPIESAAVTAGNHSDSYASTGGVSGDSIEAEHVNSSVGELGREVNCGIENGQSEVRDGDGTNGGNGSNGSGSDGTWGHGNGSYGNRSGGLSSNGNGSKGNGITSHPSLDETDGERLGHWRSLTGPSMRVTQQSICDLLRMDYDTFVNSAYLRQGRADEFTTRPPSERKHVLSEILGLAYFDRLQEACRLRARDSKTKMDLIESTLLSLPELETERDAVYSKFELRQSEFAVKDEQLKQLETSVGKLSESVQQLKLKRQKIEHDTAQLKELKSDVGAMTVQKVELERRRAEL